MAVNFCKVEQLLRCNILRAFGKDSQRTHIWPEESVHHPPSNHMNNTPLNLYTLIIAILPTTTRPKDTLEMNYRIESFYWEIYYLIYAATQFCASSAAAIILLAISRTRPRVESYSINTHGNLIRSPCTFPITTGGRVVSEQFAAFECDLSIFAIYNHFHQ